MLTLVRRVLVALVGGAAIAGLLAAPASAETDPPQLADLTLSPSVINTAAGSATVTIEIHATDAGSGIDRVIARLAEEGGGVSFTTSVLGQPSTGDPNDGVWIIEVNMPQYSPQGIYELSIELVDDHGNRLNLSQLELQGMFGVAYVVNQEAAGDLLEPTLQGVSISPASVDTSAGDRQVDLTIAGADDLSGVKRIDATLTGPNGTVVTSVAGGAPDSGVSTNGTWSVPITIPQGSPPGTYALSLGLTDFVGRTTLLTTGQIGSLGFPNSVANNDLTAPLVSITGGPSGPTNAASPTFSFTAEPGTAFECSVDQGTPAFGPCSASSAHTPASPLADGDWTFRVRATDLATNSATATRSFTVDTVVPDTQIDSGPSGMIPTKAADFTFGSELGATFECRLDGGDFQGCASPKAYADLGDGEHSFEVRAVDAAGNRDPSPAGRSFSVDAAAPWLVITSGPEGPTSNASPAFGFDAEPGSALECSFDRGNPNFGPCSTGSSDTPDQPLAEGDWTFRVRATDGGNRATTATRSFTVDLQLPETVIESGPAAKTFQNRATFAFSGEGATHFECKFDKLHKRKWFPCTSPVKFKRLAKGKHKFKVRGVDAAGNVDATPAQVNFKVVLLSL